MINQAVKETILMGINESDIIFNYSKVLCYYEKTRSKDESFIYCPDHAQIMNKLSDILTAEYQNIEDRLANDIHPKKKVFSLDYPDFIDYIKENICVALTNQVSILPVYHTSNCVSTQCDEDIFESLCNIKLDPNKNLFDNIHYNIIINNEIMKNILPCMIIGNEDFKQSYDYDYVYDASIKYLDYIINFIYSKGIDYDEYPEEELIPFLIIDDMVNHKKIDLYKISEDDLRNLILLIVFTSRNNSQCYLEYMFTKNTEIIRSVTRTAKENGTL